MINFKVSSSETGGSNAAGIDIAHPSPLTKPLIDAATGAVRNGLHAALVLSTGHIVLGGCV